MSKAQWMLFVLLSVWTLGGCESSDSADRLSRLQEQIGRVAQQLDETKKQVDGLQEANQRSVQALEDLSATVERLNSASSTLPTGKVVKGGTTTPGANPKDGTQPQAALPQGKAREVFAGQAHSPTRLGAEANNNPSLQDGDDLQSDVRQGALGQETGSTMVAMSCSQVWRQLGQGKTAEAAARTLGVSVAAIHACEQKVGRSSASR